MGVASETRREVSGTRSSNEEDMLFDSGPFGSGSPLAVLKYRRRDIIGGWFDQTKFKR